MSQLFKLQKMARSTHHSRTHTFHIFIGPRSDTVLHFHSLELSIITSCMWCFLISDHCPCNSDAGAAGQLSTTPH